MSGDTFPAFPKVPRRYRNITITEKIDGTNGLISISNVLTDTSTDVMKIAETTVDGALYRIRAGSRNRWLTANKQEDNNRFCSWVYENRDSLIADLGVGNHYGEWWGNGIQRGYGLVNGDKRFSLFNTARWTDPGVFATPKLGVVPVLYEDFPNTDVTIESALSSLRESGSYAVLGFMKPEGIVIFEHASQRLSKVTLDRDDEWKGTT